MIEMTTSNAKSTIHSGARSNAIEGNEKRAEDGSLFHQD